MDKQIEQWKQERKEGFKRFMLKYINKEIKIEQINSIPHYFIDSIEARKNNNNSYNELCHLLAWAGQLKSIGEELPDIKVKVGNPKIEKKKRTEIGRTWSDPWKSDRRFGFIGPRKKHGKTYQKQTTIFEERKNQEYTDDSVEFSDWKEVKRDTREVIINEW